MLLSLVIERKPLALLRVLSIPCWEGDPAKLTAQRNSEDKVEVGPGFLTPELHLILAWPKPRHCDTRRLRGERAPSAFCVAEE